MSGARQRTSPKDKDKEKTPEPVKAKGDDDKDYYQPKWRAKQFISYAFAQEDAAILGFFRIIWGLVMFFEIYTHIANDFQKAKVSWYLTDFHFKYYGFEWVEPMPPELMKLFLYFLLVVSFFIAIGFFYRTCAVIFFFGFSYLFLIEAAMYLNHFYLIIILCLQMIILPCNVFWSVDSLLDPSLRSETIPKWCMWFIKAELVIVYTYAGVVKINIDWLRGEPLRHWLHTRNNIPFIGHLFDYDSTIFFFSYGGIIYDITVGFLLLFPRTIKLAMAMSLFFHFSNKIIFNIGIFPYMMVGSLTLFLSPSWPRWLITSIQNLIPGREAKPFVPMKKPSYSTTRPRKTTLKEKLQLLLVISFLVHQLLLPIRHYVFYNDDVAWTEHGHRYSWRMKLRDKDCDASIFMFSNGTSYQLPANLMLTNRQHMKMTSRPEMMIQFAHHVAQIELENHGIYPEVYVHSFCQLNYREPQPICDPKVDLAREPKWEWPYKWVTEVRPHRPHELAQLPWNWEWNFNWILKGEKDNSEFFEWEDKYLHEELLKSQVDHIREYLFNIAHKHFGGDVKAAARRFVAFSPHDGSAMHLQVDDSDFDQSAQMAPGHPPSSPQAPQQKKEAQTQTQAPQQKKEAQTQTQTQAQAQAPQQKKEVQAQEPSSSSPDRIKLSKKH